MNLLPRHFKVGYRVFDTEYNQIGIVYLVSEIAIQVAFPENITRHGGLLNYARAYEQKHFIKNSRLQIITPNEQKVNLEDWFGQ